MSPLVTRPMVESRARFAFRLATHLDREDLLLGDGRLKSPWRGTEVHVGDSSPQPVVEAPGCGDTTTEVAS